MRDFGSSLLFQFGINKVHLSVYHKWHHSLISQWVVCFRYQKSLMGEIYITDGCVELSSPTESVWESLKEVQRTSATHRLMHHLASQWNVGCRRKRRWSKSERSNTKLMAAATVSLKKHCKHVSKHWSQSGAFFRALRGWNLGCKKKKKKRRTKSWETEVNSSPLRVSLHANELKGTLLLVKFFHFFFVFCTKNLRPELGSGVSRKQEGVDRVDASARPFLSMPAPNYAQLHL